MTQPEQGPIAPRTSAAIRWAWIVTALVALVLLGATVALGMRERGTAEVANLPAAAGAAQAPAGLPAPSPGPSPAPVGAAQNGLIAFVSDRDGNDEIYVMRPDGSEQTRLTEDPALDSDPVWSADGSRLAWLRIEDGNGNDQFGDAQDIWSVHVAQPDGGDHRVIFRRSGGWIESGGASRDFSQVALYAIQDDDENGELGDDDGHYLLRLGGTRQNPEPVELLEDLDGFTISQLQSNFPILWSPDDTFVYVMLESEDGPGLYALPVDGGEPTLLVEGNVLQTALSPDGQRLAVYREFEDTGRTRRRMLVHDLETGLDVTLLMGGLGLSFVNDLAWGPDGDRLLFMGSTGNSAPEIYILDVAEDTLTSLTQRVVDPAFLPAWAPDGRQAVFAVQNFQRSGQNLVPAGDANIFVSDDLGAGVVQITQGQGNNSHPVWQPVY